MFIDTTYRSKETEIMDDFSMEGDVLRDTLDKLASINKWLGGNRITINGVDRMLKSLPKHRTYNIVDLGCGHGDMLRLIAKYGRAKGYRLKLLGIDANADAISYARELTTAYDEISFSKMDIFSKEFNKLDYDIALATLFLHHFEEKDILSLITNVTSNAKIGVVINDLHRSELAYLLFRCLGLFISNTMVVRDGLTSILRAFKYEDLDGFSKKLNLKSEIRWRWAFRYQWLIRN